jgi:protein-S-isoprenylcysteine O-methyltransferase Ste14
MVILIRALTYATFFVGFLLVFLPGEILEATGVPSQPIGLRQIAGIAIAAAGAALTLACILTFVFVGKGTPAPFDPPRTLVIRGPYRWLRNPMYVGAGLALTGAAVFYGSPALAAYVGLFLLVMHVFVVSYEEPVLRQTFGGDYDAYCRRVHRWWPAL